MPKELKHQMAHEVREELDASPNVLVIGLLPMNAETTVSLRTRVREQGGRLRVIHNRTSRYALDDGRKDLAQYFKGPTAIAVGDRPDTEFIPLAKALLDAARAKNVELRGGWVDGELLDAAGVEALAKSPDKPTLRAMLCGAILGPGRGLAVAMHAVAGGLARCMQARIDNEGNEENQEEAGDAGAAS